MFDKKLFKHESINPQNEQGKYLLDLLKNNVNIKNSSFQKNIEDKFKARPLLNFSQLTKLTKTKKNETALALEERICIHI